MLQQPITGTLSLFMMLTLIRLFVKRFRGNRPKKEPPATNGAGLCFAAQGRRVMIQMSLISSA